MYTNCSAKVFSYFTSARRVKRTRPNCFTVESNIFKEFKFGRLYDLITYLTKVSVMTSSLYTVSVYVTFCPSVRAHIARFSAAHGLVSYEPWQAVPTPTGALGKRAKTSVVISDGENGRVCLFIPASCTVCIGPSFCGHKCLIEDRVISAALA